MVALKILVLVVGVRVLPGKYFRPLRLSARTGDSHSSKRGSTPLGANYHRRFAGFFIPFFLRVVVLYKMLHGFLLFLWG
jgi:hypothetical protein